MYYHPRYLTEEITKGSRSPLNRLNGLGASGMLPLPIRFKVFNGTEQINGDNTVEDNVSSEEGGEDLLDESSDVIDDEFPEDDMYLDETASELPVAESIKLSRFCCVTLLVSAILASSVPPRITRRLLVDKDSAFLRSLEL